ncbi:MAG: type II toxin-antitoxin system prevent-host-death family antitoxin [Desulfobacterales bacterium]|nr:type II toxin-antitoxin system prevent-host-death family antitoxin [Desulfobacterales bacterium]
MDSVGAYQAKTHLSQLLERVSKGERITITRHGVPVAILQPFDSDPNMDVRSAIEELRQFRNKNRLDGLCLREMIEEGRR